MRTYQKNTYDEKQTKNYQKGSQREAKTETKQAVSLSKVLHDSPPNLVDLSAGLFISVLKISIEFFLSFLGAFFALPSH